MLFFFLILEATWTFFKISYLFFTFVLQNNSSTCGTIPTFFFLNTLKEVWYLFIEETWSNFFCLLTADVLVFSHNITNERLLFVFCYGVGVGVLLFIIYFSIIFYLPLVYIHMYSSSLCLFFCLSYLLHPCFRRIFSDFFIPGSFIILNIFSWSNFILCPY